MICITSYNRPKMLLRLLKELQGEDIAVLDDGSAYNPSEHKKHCMYYRYSHYGKRGFWRLWQAMLDYAREADANEFIFLQDDLTDVRLSALRAVETPERYALNLMDVGPDRGWSRKGYVDCNFMTSRASLEAIGWQIKPVHPARWEMNPNLSSGVGQRLTQAFERASVPMILPKKNYAAHGNHESLMHPEERKNNPLIAEVRG